jgi:hypothetical protein
MPSNLKNVIPRKQCEAVQTTQYTASNCKFIIDKFTVTNTSLVNVTFSCNLPAYGELPGDANLVLKTRTLYPSETYPCPELVGQSLENLGYISTLASAATSITMSASGREIT